MVIKILPGDCINLNISSLPSKSLVIKSDVCVSADVDFNSNDDDIYVVKFNSVE